VCASSSCIKDDDKEIVFGRYARESMISEYKKFGGEGLILFFCEAKQAFCETRYYILIDRTPVKQIFCEMRYLGACAHYMYFDPTQGYVDLIEDSRAEMQSGRDKMSRT